MSDSASRHAQRRGVLPAATTALGIAVVLMALGLLRAILGSLNSDTDPAWSRSGDAAAGWLLAALGGPIVTVLGVFISLWLIAPIVSGLRPIQVILRAVLATFVGGITLFISYLLSSALTTTTEGADMLTALISALAVVVRTTPVVALGGMLLWAWLQSRSASPASFATHSTG